MGASRPARNPTTNPIILRHHRHRRRKTLRILLSRPPSYRPRRSPELPPSLPLNDGARDNTDDITSGRGDGKGGARVRHKLKDLLVSMSLEREEEAGDEDRDEGRRAKMRATLLGRSGIGGGVADGMRRLRCRLIRSSWRPVLVPARTRLAFSLLSRLTDVSHRSDGTINRRLLNFLDFRSSPNPKPIDGVSTTDVTLDVHPGGGQGRRSSPAKAGPVGWTGLPS